MNVDLLSCTVCLNIPVHTCQFGPSRSWGNVWCLNNMILTTCYVTFTHLTPLNQTPHLPRCQNTCSSHHHGQILAPWAGQSSSRPTSLRWKSPNWRSTTMTSTSNLRNVPGGSIGMSECTANFQALVDQWLIFCNDVITGKLHSANFSVSFCFSEKLWSTWSSTLKRRSLVIENQCMTGGRICILPCPCPSAETRYVFIQNNLQQ